VRKILDTTNPDRRKLNEREKVLGQLFESSGNSPTLFDPVEEPLHLIAFFVKVGTEADRVLPISSGRYVRPRATFVGMTADRKCILGFISQQHIFVPQNMERHHPVYEYTP
jgi:hypothetical protein